MVRSYSIGQDRQQNIGSQRAYLKVVTTDPGLNIGGPSHGSSQDLDKNHDTTSKPFSLVPFPKGTHNLVILQDS